MSEIERKTTGLLFNKSEKLYPMLPPARSLESEYQNTPNVIEDGPTILNVEDDNTQDPEAVENDHEIGFDTEYVELLNEKEAINNSRNIVFEMHRMQRDGIQTIVDQFGVDEVFDAIKSNEFSTVLDVVTSLEPDKAKRNEIYEKMITDAQLQGENADQDTKAGLTEDNEYWNDFHYNSSNFGKGVEVNVRNMKILDSIAGKIDVFGLLDSFDNSFSHFSTLALQNKDTEIGIKEKLAECNNDTFKFSSLKYKECLDRTERLKDQAKELSGQINDEIREVSHEIYDEMDEEIAKVLEDLEKIVDISSQMNDETIKEELNEVAEMANARINEIKESSDRRIKENTSELQNLLNNIESNVIRG